MLPWLESYLHHLGELDPLIGGVVFFFSFAFLSLLGAPIIPFAVAAGFLFGFKGGIVALLAGALSGASAGFFIGRYAARRRVEKFLNRNAKFVLIDQAIRREGWKIIGLLRLCPIPFGPSNYAYGLTDVSYRHYIFATFLGMLPAEIVFVYMGAAGRQLSEVRGSPAANALTVLGVIALVGALFLIRRVVTKRLQLAEEKP